MATSWLRVAEPIGEDPGLQAAGLAYLSDDLPTEAVVALYPAWDLDRSVDDQMFSDETGETTFFRQGDEFWVRTANRSAVPTGTVLAGQSFREGPPPAPTGRGPRRSRRGRSPAGC